MATVCPECYRPVRVKPGAKEGRCGRHRPKARRKKVRPIFPAEPQLIGGW